MHFYKNGRKMECFAQDFSVPFDASKVEESENVPGRFYVYGDEDKDGNTPWRWLTAEEQDQWAASRELHRHDDDGHGMAIGATSASLVTEGNTSDLDANEDDLGPKWGQMTDATDVPANPFTEAYQNDEAIRVTDKDKALAAIPALVATAKAVLDEVAADPLKTRFILLKIPMDEVAADGSATPSSESIVQMGTIGSDWLVEYVSNLLMQNMAAHFGLADDGIGQPANKLEV